MRARPGTVLARVVRAFGASRPDHAYLFVKRRATRLRVLAHDGFGRWLAVRAASSSGHVQLSDAEDIGVAHTRATAALVLGLPLQFLLL